MTKKNEQKKLFILAGPPGSGKTFLTRKLRGEPEYLMIFGAATHKVNFFGWYHVNKLKKEIYFSTLVEQDAPSISIKGFKLFRDYQLINPPDSLFLHVDIFTASSLDDMRVNDISRSKIKSNLESVFKILLGIYDNVYVATIYLPPDLLALRLFERLTKKNTSKRARFRKTIRRNFSKILRLTLPLHIATRVYSSIFNGSREKVIFAKSDLLLKEIYLGWEDFLDAIPCEKYRILGTESESLGNSVIRY